MRATTLSDRSRASLALSACARKPQRLRFARGCGPGAGRGREARWQRRAGRRARQGAEPLVDSGDAVADKNARERFLERTRGQFARQERPGIRSRSKSVRTSGPSPFRSSQKAGSGTSTRRPASMNWSTAVSAPTSWHHPGVPRVRRRAARVLHAQSAAGSVAALRPTSSSAPKARRTACTGPPAASRRVRSVKASRARAEGYVPKARPTKGEPFHGYIYRLLTGQGADATGGAYNYMVNDQMLGGFALIAFPAEYGNSGVMTFIVNHDGWSTRRTSGPTRRSAPWRSRCSIRLRPGRARTRD